MGEHGSARLATTSQVLWDGIHALARHLKPSYEALGERMLDAPVLHVDETKCGSCSI